MVASGKIDSGVCAQRDVSVASGIRRQCIEAECAVRTANSIVEKGERSIGRVLEAGGIAEQSPTTGRGIAAAGSLGFERLVTKGRVPQAAGEI
jgi:hypothetical protein